jgi:DASS family divalent anion:Na+ symporter
MAGNPVAQKIAIDLGVDITWSNWAKAALVPGLISLIALPFIVRIFCKMPSGVDNNAIVAAAKDGLRKLGKMTRDELITASTFIGLITLWVLERQIGINATTTAMLGVSVLLLTGVLTWHDIINEKSAWDIFIWFSILVTIANSLSEQNVTLWIGDIISASLNGYSALFTATIVSIGLFFGHYMFASTTVYFTAMYGVFLKTFLNLGLPPLASAYSLIVAIMISSGFTHYGISSAPVFFSGGYMTVKEWWKKSFGITISVAIAWVIGCTTWWYIIGWI